MRRKGCKLQEGICLDKEKQRKPEVQTNTIQRSWCLKTIADFPSPKVHIYIYVSIY